MKIENKEHIRITKPILKQALLFTCHRLLSQRRATKPYNEELHDLFNEYISKANEYLKTNTKEMYDDLEIIDMELDDPYYVRRN